MSELAFCKDMEKEEKKTTRAVFFDVGFTLLLQNEEVTLAPLHRLRVEPSPAQLLAAERFAKQELDKAILAAGPGSIDRRFWHNYHGRLLDELGLPHDGVLDELVALSRVAANWNRIVPGAFEVLRALRQRYSLGVISNADGTMAATLQKLGFDGLFESVTDSGAVGCEKPAPEIFRAAVASLRMAPEECLYVGDIYSVDYLGATAIGMEALLIDLAGTYQGSEWPRVESLSEIGARLA